MNDLLSRAMRLLSQRDHSEAELRRKLAAQPFVAKARFGGKGPHAPASPPVAEEPVDPALIEQVITYCYQHNWLDDKRFAHSYIGSRSRKGYGAQRIRSELMQRASTKRWCRTRWRNATSTGANRRNRWRSENLAMRCQPTGKRKPKCSAICSIAASSGKKFSQFTVILRNERTRGFTSL